MCDCIGVIVFGVICCYYLKLVGELFCPVDGFGGLSISLGLVGIGVVSTQGWG